MTDTVGFIRKLPHQLVNAFAATLEETKLADLVLHVVDAHETEEELEAMTRAVEDVLEEIGVGETPRALVTDFDVNGEFKRPSPRTSPRAIGRASWGDTVVWHE